MYPGLSLMEFSNDFMYPSKKTTLIIPFGNIELKGDLVMPPQVHSLVIFAHGSGSSRLSPRNIVVAEYLNRNGMATFLFDLLTNEEDNDYANRFNIGLLAERLKNTTKWLTKMKECEGLRIGYFGASTGAAAALIAASTLPEVAAIVSRGGRPDLAMQVIPEIKAATLLIVGQLDTDVLKLNQQVFKKLNSIKNFEVIAGATHLFEEKGAMEKVCVLAASWFEMHLQPLELSK
ncbi:MAG: dienelactone hydrolase family protein [Flavisolibacter sp.]